MFNNVDTEIMKLYLNIYYMYSYFVEPMNYILLINVYTYSVLLKMNKFMLFNVCVKSEKNIIYYKSLTSS